MNGNSYDPSTDSFASDLIRRQVNRLVRRGRIKPQDTDDLTQELYLHILVKMRLFDPIKGDRNAFVRTLVERRIRDTMRRMRAKKRDHRRVCSLDVVNTGDSEEQISLADVLDESALDARLGRYRAKLDDMAVLVVDVQMASKDLPKRWRILIELLKTRTISEASRILRVPRGTLYGWLRGIREHFTRAGMTIYV